MDRIGLTPFPVDEAETMTFQAGERHRNAKLSDNEVAQIRQLLDEGFHSYKTLAEKFGVSKSTIYDYAKERRR